MNNNTMNDLEIALIKGDEVDFFKKYTKRIRAIDLRNEEIKFYYSRVQRYEHYYGKEYISSLMAAKDLISYINQTVYKANSN